MLSNGLWSIERKLMRDGNEKTQFDFSDSSRVRI